MYSASPNRLPLPGAEAAALSARLRERIAGEIRSAGGWLPFARYMELALYAPGLGYYMAGAAKLGTGGDFVTAPELTPLFARAVARQVGQFIEAGLDTVLELGAGSGRMAADLLLELQRMDRRPRHYIILENSAELRERQRARLADAKSAARIEWLDSLPSQLTGVVLANEVLDALPVHLVAWRDGAIHERGVTTQADAFVWEERVADPALLAAAQAIEVDAPYLSEIGLHAEGLAATLAQRLQRGAMLFIDYGFGQREYYHPQRDHGTLMCHYRHRAHDDPFFFPGLQDITAHVNFSAIARAAARAGASLLGYTNQAQFLVNCGLTALLAETSPDQSARYLPQAAAVNRLVSPAEMGELFKVIALGKSVDFQPLGFARGELSRLL
jgi:SAM-dependent MidA family methyltransferase